MRRLYARRKGRVNVLFSSWCWQDINMSALGRWEYVRTRRQGQPRTSFSKARFLSIPSTFRGCSSEVLRLNDLGLQPDFAEALRIFSFLFWLKPRIFVAFLR